jgi:hypothetical protein
MERSINIPVNRNERSDRTSKLRKRSFRRLLEVMNLVTINCESALLSSDLEQIGCHLNNAKRYYVTMLRHVWRHPLTVQNIHALELGSVRLESTIAKLVARCAMQKDSNKPAL